MSSARARETARNACASVLAISDVLDRHKANTSAEDAIIVAVVERVANARRHE